MSENQRSRNAALDMSPEEFRALGYRVVDQIAMFLEALPELPVSRGETPADIRKFIGDLSVPQRGVSPQALLDHSIRLLTEHSVFNGHPRFLGYITSSATPIGALGDLLAAAVNPNVGGWPLSPMASEIERQTIRWIAELIGFPADAGGILVSGGNMANFAGFLAGRKARAPWDVRTKGMCHDRAMRVYASAETHTWIHKAADMFGLGTDAIRWIQTDNRQRMRTDALREAIVKDKHDGLLPLMVIGTAGSVSTGAVDPLPEIAAIAKEHDLWFHVDGAYGGFAAMVPDAPPDLKGLSRADSVAVDPHKWLYAPLEAGCALVRNPQHLLDAFSYRPPYYHLEEDDAVNYYEYGMQNSRGFRALKVWLAIRQIGRKGYEQLLSEDIRLTHELFKAIQAEPELEAVTCGLSIATFRCVPQGPARDEDYLNRLNTELLERLQKGGELFVSNAVVDGKYLLRTCIVNFRTSIEDVKAIPEIVVRTGREVAERMKTAG